MDSPLKIAGSIDLESPEIGVALLAIAEPGLYRFRVYSATAWAAIPEGQRPKGAPLGDGSYAAVELIRTISSGRAAARAASRGPV